MTTPRTITFKSNNLGDDVILHLSFSPIGSMSELYRTDPPVGWKVATLSGSGPSSLTVTYENNLAFSTPQVDNGNLIIPSTYRTIKPGEETVLTIKPTDPPSYAFSDPTIVSGTSISATNSTGGTVDLGVGFVTGLEGKNPIMNTVVFFDNVGNGILAKADFLPVLSAYLNVKSTNDEVFVDDPEKPQPVWTQNLINLTPSSTWIISRTADGFDVANADDSIADHN